LNYIQYLNEVSDETKRNFFEILFGHGSIVVDLDEKKFSIKGINYNKFLLRLKEMYETNGILHLFEERYTWWSQMMWKQNKIKGKDRKISSLDVPLFFALEMYYIFDGLADHYGLAYYRRIAKSIFEKTWISNYLKREAKEPVDTSFLQKLQYEPKDYQRDFIMDYKKLKYSYDLDGYILSFDQGLGKTFTSIALAEMLHKEKICIVCPNSLKENWALEIKQYYKKYSDEKLWKQEVFVSGSSKLNNFNKNSKFIIVNQESIQKIFPLIQKLGEQDYMIIVDESHNFRNLNSQRTVQLLKLKEITKCKDNLIMSGTPIKATPNEIIPALLMIDPYFTPELAAIYNKTFNVDKIGIAQVVSGRFDRDMYRKTKKEVLKLPDKHIEEIYVNISGANEFLVSELSKEIRTRYEKYFLQRFEENKTLSIEFAGYIKKYSDASPSETKQYIKYMLTTSNIGNHLLDRPDIKAKQMRDDFSDTYKLHQIRKFLKDHIYPNIKDPNEYKKFRTLVARYVNMVDSAKGVAIGEVLPPARNKCYIKMWEENKKKFIDMINNNPKKTIIFTPFLPVCNYIYEDLKKNNIGVVQIIGGTKNRMDLIQQFKNDDSIDVLIATTQTLSTGVTLTEATQMFFFGTPWRSADYNQAMDRIYRIGQTHDVYIYTVLLNTDTQNITTRMQEIVNWSDDMFNSIVNEDLNTQLPSNIYLRPATYNKTDMNNMYKWEMDSIGENLRNQPKVIKYIKNDVKKSVNDTYMIMDRNKTIGMFTAYYIDNKEWWYIGTIYLIEEYRNKGIGSILLKDQIKHHDKIKLKVSHINKKAIKLYKSLGFKIIKDNKPAQIYIMAMNKK